MDKKELLFSNLQYERGYKDGFEFAMQILASNCRVLADQVSKSQTKPLGFDTAIRFEPKNNLYDYKQAGEL